MNVTYSMELDDKMKDKLEKIANDQRRSLASQIRLILEEYLDGLKQK